MRRQWAMWRAKADASPLRMLQGMPCGITPEQTMVKPQEGRKHDKRQQLVGYLKRFMRQPWFARLVIGVVWKLLDRFF